MKLVTKQKATTFNRKFSNADNVRSNFIFTRPITVP